MRIISGRGAASAQDILILAQRVADRAWALGLAVISFRASHIRGSASRYITLRDARGHEWAVRVSNHRRPRANKHAVPHLDVISLDGASGFDQAAGWLERVALGELPWEPARTDSRRPRPRRRG